jgi:iron complex outermembrane receptor protein
MGWRENNSGRLGVQACAFGMLAICNALTEVRADAQTGATEQTQTSSAQSAQDTMPIIVVVGKRASLIRSQEIKQEKLEIVDSVIAEDMQKLPDFNVTDAMSRVTGVQILRDRGEGAGVAIRGLTQIESTLNGREVFTAGNGRTLDFADIPSEMLAGVDVYKTPSADHLEGGVGGLVDVRTRRPFDFPHSELSGSVRSIYGDLVKKSEPQYSMLASSRWNTEALGQVGLLFNAANQKRAWREDQKSAGAPFVPVGQTFVAPNGITESISVGQRERKSASVVLEWTPQESLQLYAEAHYAEFLTKQDTYQIYGNAPTNFVTGSPVLFPGTNDIQSITWTNATLTTVGAARDTLDRTSQFAVGGTWTDAALTLKSDVSYTRSHNNLFYSTITLTGNAATLTQDLSSGVPSSSIGGSSLSSLDGFTSAGMWYAARPFDGELKAAKLDGEYQLYGSVINSLLVGVRIAKRHASDAPGQVTSFPSASKDNAAGLVIANPYANYMAGDPAAARDVAGARATLGITGSLPTSNPLGTWDIAENTQSGYFMAKFNAQELPLEGNAGMRAVHTNEVVIGNRGATTGPFIPVNLNSSYNDYLPSANLRYTLDKGLYLRAAASKTITRQDFNLMSPSLTLNPAQFKGTAGNPDLKPIRANNFDLALERYFSETTSAYLTGFYKKVDGFIATKTSWESYDGLTYQVDRPQNSSMAHIKGLEIGYQQFYDFLPGWLNGLGLQANYTYVDSKAPSSVLGMDIPLQNLSKNSYNIIGMYEKGELSARLAYNWRSRFISSIGAAPVYTKAYGWLDASMTYQLSKKVSLTLEGTNLLKTVRTSYYGVETRPQSSWVNDRQISLSMAFKL